MLAAMSTLAQLRLRQLGGILRDVRNPLPLVLDWLHLKRRPYVARTRAGLEMELRPGLGDWFSFYENLVDQQYLRNGQRLSPGDAVIDVGANIGCFSTLAASRVGRSGKVIAAEPSTPTYRQLLANLERTGSSNVTPRHVAVGGRTGSVQIRSARNALYSSIYSQVGGREVGGQVETVPLVTVDQLMREADLDRCALLKVDCEGGEYEIFECMQRETAARIEQIVMELHEIPHRNPHALLNRLRELGFDVRPGNPVYASR
jgi:FkbM family methyltransferase